MPVKVVCHMISSLDGGLMPERWGQSVDKVDVSGVYEATAERFAYDGWMIGRTTMAEYAACVSEGKPSITEVCNSGKTFSGDRGGRPIAVVFDPKGKLRYTDHVLPSGEHLVAVLGRNVSEDYLHALRSVGVGYVFESGCTDVERFSAALSALETVFGVKTMMLEGGGVINGAFLRAGMIDELSVLVYPGIDGLKGAATIFDCLDESDALPGQRAHLKLLECETLPGGVVWLHYNVRND